MNITVYTFPVSHFAEKVRWLLDYSGIPFQVVNWVPLDHAPAAYLKSGNRTVPFIEVSNGTKRFVVHDSTEIIHWVHNHFSPIDLIPDDPQQFRDAMDYEDKADAVGDDVIRYMYTPMIQQPRDFVGVWGWDAKPLYRGLLRLGLPIVKLLLDRHLDFSEAGCAAGQRRLHNLFGELDQRLTGGRRYLVGEQFSIADVSVASLLAPIYAPEAHPVYSSHHFSRTLSAQRAEFTHYKSFGWLQMLYAHHRAQTATNRSVYCA